MGDLRANAIVSGRRERDLIAVIDDDPFVLEAMAGLLRKWGYEVLTAATDRAALDTFDERRRPPDLIVCDYHLSNGLTGIEAIERLRNAFRIPAFLITGDAALAELPQVGALGVRGVLQVETRGPFKGPRAYDASGLPLHLDNQSVFMERILLDRADPNILHDEITVIDHALTRPRTVDKKYLRDPNPRPDWIEFYCTEGNHQLVIGQENYFLSADGLLMPTKKDQAPPNLRYFKKTRR